MTQPNHGPGVHGGRWRLPWGLSALGVAASLAVAAFLWWPSASRVSAQSSAASSKDTGPLARREFIRRLRLTGLTEATRSYVVTTPLLAGTGPNQGQGPSLVVTKLAAAGSRVKSGDLLVTFDQQLQEKLALDKKAEFEDLTQQIAQKKAEHEAARVKDESEIAQAEHAVKNYELEVLKNEMLSRVKAEKNDQDLDEARAKIAMLRESFDLKRAAAAAELRILEIKRERARAAMDHASANAKAMTVYSPLDGLVVPKLTWRGNGPADIQEGDEMWPGAPVLQVVNQSSMLVRARINQADLPSVKVGMPVTMRLDAYPDLQMPGRISQLAPIGISGSFSPRVRAFAAVVAIEGSNARLLPDLTAAIDVEVERVKDAIVVPRDTVTMEGTTARVRVRNASGVSTRQVTLGPADEVDVVVTSGLQPGEVVVR
jgi:HlyD family secretion protein